MKGPENLKRKCCKSLATSWAEITKWINPYKGKPDNSTGKGERWQQQQQQQQQQKWMKNLL